ncbi:hypothetical protein, partial [Bartonella sp. ML69XJBT]|uniref:hypothetical protein n=1 Tax=Bartonella sp. ML69XJBT TaxID=3019092 RepID=UPI00235E7863
MCKKYELTRGSKKIKHALTRKTINLYRIRALKDFDDVKTGDLGGFIEKESNLSHDGNCWVYDKACVYGHARVSDNAKIRHFSQICGQVYGNCEIYGKAFISQYAKVYDHACVYGNAHVYGNVYGYAHVSGGARVFADAHVYDYAHVSYDATVFGYARVYGRAIVAGSAHIHSYAEVYN